MRSDTQLWTRHEMDMGEGMPEEVFHMPATDEEISQVCKCCQSRKAQLEKVDQMKLYPATVLFSEPENPIDWEEVFIKSMIGIAAIGAVILLVFTILIMIKILQLNP